MRPPALSVSSLLLALTIACSGDDGAGSSNTGSSTDGTTTATSSTGPTTTADTNDTDGMSCPDQCQTSSDCPDDGFCVLELLDGPNGCSYNACQPTCLIDATFTFCIDDSSCCAGLTCPGVGYPCQDPGGSTGTSTSTSTGG